MNYGFSFPVIQHINLSTHVAGNTLDLILTCDDVSMTHIHTDHSFNSDHCAVLFHLSCVSPGTVRKSITYRKWKAVDIASVQSDISGAFIDFSPHDLSSAKWFYNDTLADIVEKHARKNHGLWLSEQTNLGIRRNFLLKNGCGVNVKG